MGKFYVTVAVSATIEVEASTEEEAMRSITKDDCKTVINNSIDFDGFEVTDCQDAID